MGPESRATAIRWIYAIVADEYVKVGMAVDVKSRLNTFKAAHPPGRLRLHCKWPVSRVMCRQVEMQAHQALAAYAVGREWFKVEPAVVTQAVRPILQRAARAHRALEQNGFFIRG